jgi:hypothetical protein
MCDHYDRLPSLVQDLLKWNNADNEPNEEDLMQVGAS